jgi:hypothetical protein
VRTTPAASPQGPLMISKDFRLDRTPLAPIRRDPGWQQQRRTPWSQPVYVGLC